MIKFIGIYCVRNFFTDGRPIHIQSLKLVLSNSILTHTNKLNPANTRILARVFRKALSLAKVILEIRTMRLKNINHISYMLVFPNDNKIWICRFDFPIDFIWNTKCP